jgi:hypothetical protein
MSDQQAAEAAGLNPATASYTKAKPRVQAWMQHYRAAMDKLILEQEAEKLRRRSETRERVLNRLWAIADLGPEQTRNSMVSQMKALATIVAIEELVPDRRASAQKLTAPTAPAKIYQAAWLRPENTATTSGSGLEPPTPNAQPENTSASPETEQPPQAPVPDTNPSPHQNIPPRAATFAMENSSPYTSFVPDTRSFQLPRNPFSRRAR